MVSLLTLYLSKDKDGLGFMHIVCATQLCDGTNGCGKMSRVPCAIAYIMIPQDYRECIWCGEDLREKVQA